MNALKNLDLFILFYMYGCVLSAYMYVYYIHGGCLHRSEKGVIFPASGVMDGCEAPYE